MSGIEGSGERHLRFGIGLQAKGPASEIVARAQFAEELGYDALWIGDTHINNREMFTILGAIAAATKRIHLAPGVTHPVIRHPSLTAAAMTTLWELAHDRVELGIGVGDTGPANMGLPRASLRQLEEAIIAIRALIAGEEVVLDGHPMRLGYAGGAHVPIYIAAAADKSQQLGGRVADGMLLSGPAEEFGDNAAAVHEGERTAGRTRGTVDLVFWSTASVDDDPIVAREAVRPLVAKRVINSLGARLRRGTLAPEDKEPLERLQKAFDTHFAEVRPELVLERWVDRFTLSGTPKDVIAKCNSVAQSGASQVAAIFPGANDAQLRQQMTKFAEMVISPMRERIKAG